MSDDVLSRARKLLAGITPGTWHMGTDERLYAQLAVFDENDAVIARFGPEWLPEAAEDAAFIAAAPDLVRALVERLEKLEALTWE